MHQYIITTTLPLAGSADGLSYGLKIDRDPSGSGYALILEQQHVGLVLNEVIISSPALADPNHQIQVTGFSPSGAAQIALDDLVGRRLATRR
jgi:hypothetical protein